MNKTYRYDLASATEPRVILITSDTGKRSDVPRLGYVVMPTIERARDFYANRQAKHRLVTAFK